MNRSSSAGGAKSSKDDKDTLRVPLRQNGATPRSEQLGRASQFNLSTGAPRQPDGGWGWVVCLTSMFTNGTVFGIINTFGILYVAMRDHYAKGDDNISFKTAWVGSVATGMTFSICMLSSIISDQVGIRATGVFGGILAFAGMLSSAFVEELMLLYLTYGIMLGVGFAFAYAPSLVILGHYFKRHLGLVNGLVTFGSSVFTMTLALVLPELLATIGLRYTLIVLSGLCLTLVLNAWTWKPIFTRDDDHHSGTANAAVSVISIEAIQSRCNNCMAFTKKFLNVDIWKNKGYVIWALGNGFSLFGYFVPFVHIVKHVEDTLPDHDGKFLVMCLSITSGVARVFLGKMADFKWVNRIRMQQLAFTVLGVCTLCIPFSHSFTGLIVITLIMGVCDGAFICLLGPIAFDLVGERSASQALGFLFGIFSIPMTVGPPVAGFLYDSLGSYDVAFHLAGCPPIIGAIILFFVPKIKPQRPAVVQIQEFAAVSCHDIYQSKLEFSTENVEILISPADAAKVTPHILTLDDFMTPTTTALGSSSGATNGQAVVEEDKDERTRDATAHPPAVVADGAAVNGKDEVGAAVGDATKTDDNVVVVDDDNKSGEEDPMLPKITITEPEDSNSDNKSNNSVDA